jgi:hypothetical protein
MADQFDRQRYLYQTKFMAFWSDTVTACRNNPRALWKAINSMLKPPQRNGSTKLSVDDFAALFSDKVEKFDLQLEQQSHRSSAKDQHLV